MLTAMKRRESVRAAKGFERTMDIISVVMDKERKDTGRFVNSASLLHARLVLQREAFGGVFVDRMHGKGVTLL